MAALPVTEAAAAMGVRPGTLRGWIRRGCPVASRGRRGRGHAVLVDPATVREWLQAGSIDAVLLGLAGAIPELLATATLEALQRAEGLDKRRLAGVMAATWYVGANAVLDHMREQCSTIPELAEVPEEIERLRKIAR